MTHGILTFALIYAVDHDYDPFRPHNVIKKVSKGMQKARFWKPSNDLLYSDKIIRYSPYCNQRYVLPEGLYIQGF